MKLVIEADTTPAFPQSVITKTFYKDRPEEWAFPMASGLNYHFNDSRYSISPDLPIGVQFGSNNGIVTDGTFTIPSPATKDYTLKVTDRDGDTATATLRITYADLPSGGPEFVEDSIRIRWIVNADLDRLVDQGDLILPGAGGAATTYSLSGTLPAGLTFVTATHALSGEPSETGEFSVTLTATDSQSRTDTLPITIIVTPVREPWAVRPAGASCTSMSVRWQQPDELGQNKRTADGYTSSGYQVQGQEWGVDTVWKDVGSTSSATATSYTHSVPSGSSWDYRVRAVVTKTSDQTTHYGPWSPPAGASTTRRADTDGSVLEVGQVFRVLSQGRIGGSVVGSWQWYRAKDETPVVWKAISGATENKYEFTADDVGHVIRVDRFDLAYYLTHSRRSHTGRDTQFLFTMFHIPVVSADNAPSFAKSSVRYDPIKAGDELPDGLATDLAATGGSVPVKYAISPALPAGLTFNTATGAITGTPAVDWGGSYTVTATDADCDQATMAVEIAQAPASPIPEGVPLRVTASVAGLVPPGTRFTVGYSCPGLGGAFHIWPGESRYAYVPDGSPCSLRINDDGGARTVSGTFENRTFTYETYVPLLFDFTEPAPAPEPQPEPEPEPEPEPAVATVETRVWQSVRDPERLWLSARIAGGSWATLGTVRLPLEESLIPGGRFRATTITLDAPIGDDDADDNGAGGDSGDNNGDDDGDTVTIEVRVVRDNDIGAVYINARPEDGPWASKTALTVAFDGLSRSGRYRYGDNAIEVPLEDAAADAPEAAEAR